MRTPTFWRYYGQYASSNYGVHCLAFRDAEGNEYFYSYQTLVAFYVARTGKRFCIKNYWSTTTGKHLNAIEPDHNMRVDKDTFEQLLRAAFGDEKY